MRKQHALAIIAVIGVIALVAMFLWTIFVLVPTKGRAANGDDHALLRDLGPPTRPSDDNWGCDLADAHCRHETERRALGGDPAAQFQLVRYYMDKNSGDYTSSTPLVEEFVWSALGACSGGTTAMSPEPDSIIFCPISYDEDNSFDLPPMKRNQSWLQRQVCEQEGELERKRRRCMGPETWEQCMRAVRINQSRINANLNAIMAALSTKELKQGRGILRERLSRSGASGLVQVGDLHQRGCGLERSNVKAGAAYLAASRQGSTYGRELWTSLTASMTDREIEQAQKLSKSFSYDVILDQERGKLLTYLDAERISVASIRHALYSLGHYPPKCDPKDKYCDEFGRALRKDLDPKHHHPTRNPKKHAKVHEEIEGKSAGKLVHKIKDKNSAFLGSKNAVDGALLESVKSFQRCEKLAPTGKLSVLTSCKILEVAALGGRSEPTGEVNACHPNTRNATGGALNLWGLSYAYGVCNPKDLKLALQYVEEAQNVLGGYPPAYVSAEKIYSEKLAPCAITEEERNQYLKEAQRYRQLAYDKLGDRYKDEVGKLWKGFLSSERVAASDCF